MGSSLHNHVLRTVGICLLLSRCAVAQDEGTQRILPLPERGASALPGLQKQMEWLQKLREQVPDANSDSAEPNAGKAPSNAADGSSQSPADLIQTFRDALKGIADRLPDGFQPPDLSQVPRDQLEEALKSPEVQRQVRDVLEQFARDGVLPPMSLSPDDPPGIIPRSNPEPSEPPSSSQDEPAGDFEPNGGRRQPIEPAEQNQPQASDASDVQNAGEQESGPQRLPESSLRALEQLFKELVEPPAQSGEPRASDDRGLPRPPLRRRDPSGKQDDVSRDEDASRDDRPAIDGSPSDPVDRQPPRVPQRRDDDVANPNAGTMPQLQGNQLQQLQDLLGSPELIEDLIRQSTEGSGEDSFGGQFELPQSVQEFVREQMRSMPPDAFRGFRSPDRSESPRSGQAPGDDDRDASRVPGQSTGPDTNSAGSADGSRSPDATERSRREIAEELERSGFRGALKKIMEDAQRESRESPQEPVARDDVASNAPADAGEPRSLQMTPQMERSVIELLDGMKDELRDLARDGQIQRSPAEPLNRRSFDGSPAVRTPREPSMLDSLRKSVAGFLSEVQRSPTTRSASSGAAAGAASPASPIAFDMTPVLVLGGLLLAATIFAVGRNVWRERRQNATLETGFERPIQPAELRTRSDIVSAFHQFARSGQQRAATWWTHTAVAEATQRADSPIGQSVVEFAELYEAARYQPTTSDLSPDRYAHARDLWRQLQPKPA